MVQDAIVRIGRPDGGTGSGFIVDGEGWVLTNAHVVAGYSDVIVTLGGRFEFVGKVVGVDEEVDLAVVKIEAEGDLPIVSLGDSDLVAVGDDVFAVGYPLGPALGTAQTVTRGIVSSERRIGDVNYLQTDAAINPGNSGGPLVNSTGDVIGINTARIIQVFGQPIQGIGLAIAANNASELLPLLMAGGVAGPLASPTASMASKYVSQEYWYTIDVPQGWSVDDSDPDGVVVESGNARWAILVRPYDRSQRPDFRAFARSTRPSLPEGGSELHVEPETTVAGDEPIVRREITFTYVSDDRRVKAKALIVIVGDIWFWMPAVAWEDDWADVESDIDSLLASFDPIRHRSDQFEYSVSAPLDWSIDESDPENVVIWNPNSTVSIRVDAENPRECTDVSSYAQRYAPTHPAGDYEITKQYPVREQEDIPGYRFETSWTTSDGTSYRGSSLYTLEDCFGRILWASASEEDWIESSDTLEAIIQRFNVR